MVETWEELYKKYGIGQKDKKINKILIIFIVLIVSITLFFIFFVQQNNILNIFSSTRGLSEYENIKTEQINKSEIYPVPKCSSDLECDDNNAATTDICKNPGLSSSYCINNLKSCKELVGTVCELNEKCEGFYINSSDSTRCCSTSCIGSSFDFSLSANPIIGSVTRGSNKTAIITVSQISGIPQIVSLDCSGLPPGASCSFSPASLIPSASSVLTISTSSTTPVGMYTVTLTGTGGITRTLTYELNITTPSVDYPPSITISYSPLNPTSTDTVTITTSATDDRSLSEIKVYVDGTLKKTCIASNTSSSCFYQSMYSVGTHNYYATAKDSAENTVNSSIGQFTVASAIDTIPPSAVTNLATNNPTQDSITLTWTAPGDDGVNGIASQYDIRYLDSSQITASNWASAIQVSGEPQPKTAGSAESFTITGLKPNTLYYFALKAADEVPNWSEISNSPSRQTSAQQVSVAVILVTSMSTTVGGADGCPSVSTTTSLNVEEINDIKTVVSNIISEVSNALSNALILNPKYYEVSGTISLTKNNGCNYWLAPWDLNPLVDTSIDKNIDFILVFYDMVDDSTGIIKVDSALGGGTFGADWGINGAGYSVQAMRYGDAPYDTSCDQSNPSYNKKTCGIKWLTQTTLHEWLHQLDYALSHVSYVSDIYPNGRSDYPSCGSAPINTYSWFPSADDCTYDPDYKYCGYSSCGTPSVTYDILMEWNRHVLQKHYLQSTKFIGNHCRNGIKDNGESGIDIGGNGAATCP